MTEKYKKYHICDCCNKPIKTKKSLTLLDVLENIYVHKGCEEKWWEKYEYCYYASA